MSMSRSGSAGRWSSSACAATGVLGASGALIAATLHNVSTLVVMANAGRLLKFQEPVT